MFRRFTSFSRALGAGILISAGLWASRSLPAQTTTATSLASFGGVEEPTILYFPLTGTFTDGNTFVNITDSTTNSSLPAGTFQMQLRYTTNANTTWWDGDRGLLETDRGRAEVKSLGPNQTEGTTYIYTTTWRTNPQYVGSGRFDHITQLKPVDGVEGSSGAPLITTSLGSGTSSADVDYASASFSPAEVFSPVTVRSFSWAPNAWLAEQIKVTPSGDGQATGQVQVSVNGDSFQGVSNVEVCRPNSTTYYPKWGLYRSTNTTSNFSAADYIQHSNVTASLAPVVVPAAAVTASTYSSSYPPANTVDGILTTASRWAAKGNPQWIQYDLGANYSLAWLKVAFPYANIFSFDVLVSTNGTTWTNELLGQVSNGSVNTFQTYTLPAVTARYVRLNCHGSNADTWNNITEVQIFGSATFTPEAGAPAFSVAGGSYATSQTVSLTSATSGASIYYTTDGSTPSNTHGTLYSGPVTVSSTTTIKAVAYASGLAHSSVSVAAYTIQTAAPVFGVADDTYTSAQTVALTSATSGASIYYTTDGSTPSNTHGTLYTHPLTIGSTTALEAIAYSGSLPASTVTIGLYTIWTDADIGSPPIAGSASASNGVLTVNGCGSDIYGTSDQFNYLYQAVSGNLAVTAQTATQTNTNAWAKSGVMIRNSTAAGDMFVDIFVTPGNGVAMQYRSAAGGSSKSIAGPAGVVAPYWVQLIRSGNTFTGYSSPDQITWTQVGSVTIPMNTAATAGLEVCSHSTAALNTSTFQGAAISQ